MTVRDEGKPARASTSRGLSTSELLFLPNCSQF